MSGVLAKATKNILLSAISKKISIKKESFSGIFFKIMSLKIRNVINKNVMFENTPRVIKENKKIAELNFIPFRSIMGTTLFRSLSSKLGNVAS